jgi:acetyl-CoA C-acetyltransferase
VRKGLKQRDTLSSASRCEPRRTSRRGFLRHAGPKQIDDVLIGQCHFNGEAPGMTDYQPDRRSDSRLQTMVNAAMQVQTGASEIILVGSNQIRR